MAGSRPSLSFPAYFHITQLSRRLSLSFRIVIYAGSHHGPQTIVCNVIPQTDNVISRRVKSGRFIKWPSSPRRTPCPDLSNNIWITRGYVIWSNSNKRSCARPLEPLDSLVPERSRWVKWKRTYHTFRTLVRASSEFCHQGRCAISIVG